MPLEQQRRDYFEALAWVTTLLTRTDPAQLTNSTPCAEFDVRALTGHLIGTGRRGLATAEGADMRGIPLVITDVPDARLATTYADLAERIRVAWPRLRHDDQVRAPWGWCSALEAARGFTVETVVHGWDLAVATHQPSTELDHIAERCLDFATDTIPTRLRGVMYDDPVESSQDASPTKRLAHHLGRR